MILLFVFVFNWHLKTIFFRPLLKSKTWKAVCKWHHVEVRWVIFFFLMVSSLLCYIVAWCTGLSPGPCLAPGSPGHCSLCVCVWGGAGWGRWKGWGAWAPPCQGSPARFTLCGRRISCVSPLRPSIVECRKEWLSLLDDLNILTMKPSYSTAWLVYLSFCKLLPGQQKRAPCSLNT